MKDFTDWYAELIKDERFYENASRNHRKETVESTARKVYETESLNRDTFEIKPIVEHRRHVLQKLYKILPDKIVKPWHQIQLEEKQQEEAKNKKPEEPPLVRGSEQYLKRLQEFQSMVDNSPMMKTPPPLTAKERIEGENLRPKPEAIREPSQEEKIKAAREYTEKMQRARVKIFREKYPDGNVKQLREYLKKWKHIDNPFNL